MSHGSKPKEGWSADVLARVFAKFIVGKTIFIPKNVILGIRAWGMVDFLCNHNGYTLLRRESNG